MLTHRRLSILDLSSAASQPMVDPITRDVLDLNGEIYNFQDLRRLLVERGQSFQSSGDTAVMLRALALDGPQAVRTMRGMFAFAHWDESERTLTLARDPLGIKPLYFASAKDERGEWSLVFASEVRAILASGLLARPRLDPGAAASILWNGYIVGPETAVAGVEAVWPGEIISFDSFGSQIARERYHTLRPTPGPETNIEEAGTAVEESVRAHLISDVPVAVFLSSGVDSAAIANLAQRVSSEQIHTFTVAFQEKEFSEAENAAKVAAAIGTRHQEVVLSEADFVEDFDNALDALDQPTFDGLNGYFISKAVARAGFKVALSGMGGDELFGGYSSFRELPRLWKLINTTRSMSRPVAVKVAKIVATILQPKLGAYPQQTRWAKLPDMVARGPDLIALYQLAYSLFLPGSQRELLVNEGDLMPDGISPAMKSRLLEETESLSPTAAISVLEQRLFQGERLLRDSDSTSMASSLELRVPLVDVRVADSVSRLADANRYQRVGSKNLLRQIGLKGLDPELFARPKTGFTLPYDRWLRSALGNKVNTVLRDPSRVRAAGLNPPAVSRLWQAFLGGNSGLYWSRIWAIYVLIMWCEQYHVFAEQRYGAN